MQTLEQLEKEQIRLDHPHFAPGDTVKVHVKIREGEKERIQVYQGVVISKRGGNTTATFTVRKISYGVGVERVFPLHSPLIDHIEIVTRGKVRRSRLYYLRKLSGKAARIKEQAYEEAAEVAGGEPEIEEGKTAAAAVSPKAKS